MSGDKLSLEGFGGTARLFPLPNLVLFPHVVQPLHIFEPRYRQMMADALEDDRLMALALLQPGWEKDYHNCPPIYPVVCLGRIYEEVKLPDGRFNLLLQGLSRARVVQEVPTDKLYRSAQVELLQEIAVPQPQREQSLLHEIESALRERFVDQPEAVAQLQQLWTANIALGQLSDVLAFALPLEVEAKQQLLQELDSEKRALLLLEQLRPGQKPPTQEEKKWPPQFSSN